MIASNRLKKDKRTPVNNKLYRILEKIHECAMVTLVVFNDIKPNINLNINNK